MRPSTGRRRPAAGGRGPGGPWPRIAAALALLCAAPEAAADDAAGAHRHQTAPAVEARSGWARASAGRAANGAAYLVIVNSGERDDRLTAAASDVAARTEIHAHTEDGDGVMRMRRLDGIDLPAGEAVRLRPGGLHLMLFGLRAPLIAGDRFTVDLSFASGATGRVEVVVRPIGAPGRPDPAMHRHMRR